MWFYILLKWLIISFCFTGYCFSASLPPLLSAAAIKALDKIDKHPEMLVTLRERSISLHQRIFRSQLTKHFTLGSDERSPLKHLYLSDKSLSHSEQETILKQIVDYVSKRLYYKPYYYYITYSKNIKIWFIMKFWKVYLFL